MRKMRRRNTDTLIPVGSPGLTGGSPSRLGGRQVWSIAVSRVIIVSVRTCKGQGLGRHLRTTRINKSVAIGSYRTPSVRMPRKPKHIIAQKKNTDSLSSIHRQRILY